MRTARLPIDEHMQCLQRRVIARVEQVGSARRPVTCYLVWLFAAPRVLALSVPWARPLSPTTSHSLPSYCTQVLAVNHVFEMLLHFTQPQGGDWSAAVAQAGPSPSPSPHPDPQALALALLNPNANPNPSPSPSPSPSPEPEPEPELPSRGAGDAAAARGHAQGDCRTGGRTVGSRGRGRRVGATRRRGGRCA